MQVVGYYMDKGFAPAEILSLSREEFLVYTAIAELNQKQQQMDLETAMIRALNKIPMKE